MPPNGNIAFMDREDICVAFVAARITGTRLEDIRDFTGQAPPYTFNDLYRYLAHHNIRMGLSFPFREPAYVDPGMAYDTGLDPIGRREAVLSVYARVKGEMQKHCIYFDGASVYDPLYGDGPTPPVSKYLVKLWCPLFRM